MGNRNISVQPQGGQQLPANWQAMAKERAASAQKAYQDRLESAWRGEGHQGAVKEARLEPSWRDLFGEK